jgi:hypothetical protein
VLNRYFLCHNIKLKKINIPNVKEIKTGALESNKRLRYISVPKLEEVGSKSFENNIKIKYLLKKQIKKNKRSGNNG